MIPSPRPASTVRLWRTLLTSLALLTAAAHAQTSHLVKDTNRTLTYSLNSTHWVMPVGTGEKVVMPFVTIASGCELWTSDGTAKGTRLLKDLIPGPASSYPYSPLSFSSGEGSKVAFQTSAPDDAGNVWVTHGTEEGTVRVFDSNRNHTSLAGYTSMCGSIPGGFFFENRLEEPADRALYFSDGTEAGTWRVYPAAGETPANTAGPSAYAISGSVCYFLTATYEIWRSDGTPAGTSKLLTLPQPNLNHTPESLAVAGSRLFIEGTLNGEPYFWRCPIVGGDLTDITPPEAATAEYIHFQPAASIGDDVFFSMGGGDTGYTLWASDGFTSGTRRIPLVIPGDPDERLIISEIVKWRGDLYFIAGDATNNNRGLWRYDGTTAVHLKTFGDVFVDIPAQQQSDTAEHLYLQVASEDHFTATIWQTKGDAASTQPVKNMPAILEYPDDGPQFAHYQGGIIFSASPTRTLARPYMARGKNGRSTLLVKVEKSTGDGVVRHPWDAPSYELLDGYLLQIVDTGKGHELWRMNPDGSKAKSVSKLPEWMNDYNDKASFHGITPSGAVFALEPEGDDPRQIYVTDGTRKGTRLLSQHQTQPGPEPIKFQRAGDLIFYAVADPESNQTRSLWMTDGTVSGTSQVLAIDGTSPGSISYESPMVPFQGSLWFIATGSNGKSALWRSDGTAAGTVLIKDQWIGVTGEHAVSLSAVGGKLYLGVGLPGSYALWESDGTAGGTMPTNPMLNFGSIGPAVDLGGTALFVARATVDANEQWWRHLGNDTSRVRDGISGRQVDSSDSRFYAVAGTQLFYRGYSPEGDAELWATDGTSAGTRLVKDFYPGPGSSYPSDFQTSGNSIYFFARSPYSGNRYWRSDGTEAGTTAIDNSDPHNGNGSPSGLKEMGGKLYFHFSRPDIGEELHYVDLPLE